MSRQSCRPRAATRQSPSGQHPLPPLAALLSHLHGAVAFHQPRLLGRLLPKLCASAMAGLGPGHARSTQLPLEAGPGTVVPSPCLTLGIISTGPPVKLFLGQLGLTKAWGRSEQGAVMSQQGASGPQTTRLHLPAVTCRAQSEDSHSPPLRVESSVRNVGSYRPFRYQKSPNAVTVPPRTSRSGNRRTASVGGVGAGSGATAPGSTDTALGTSESAHPHSTAPSRENPAHSQ